MYSIRTILYNIIFITSPWKYQSEKKYKSTTSWLSCNAYRIRIVYNRIWFKYSVFTFKNHKIWLYRHRVFQKTKSTYYNSICAIFFYSSDKILVHCPLYIVIFMYIAETIPSFTERLFNVKYTSDDEYGLPIHTQSIILHFTSTFPINQYNQKEEQ